MVSIAALWLPILERILRDEIERSRDRLLRLVAPE